MDSCSSNTGVSDDEDAQSRLLSAFALEPGRGNGYPFKRYLSSAPSTKSHSIVVRADCARPPLLSPVSGQTVVRLEKTTDGLGPSLSGKNGFRRAYKLLFWVLTCCFVLQFLGLLLMRSRDPLSSKIIGWSLSPGSSDQSLEKHGVRFTPRIFRQASGTQRRRAMDVTSPLALRRPRLALVCSNLDYTPESVYLMTIGKAIQALGYKLELYAFDDGPMRYTWKKLRIPCNLLQEDEMRGLNVNWLNFEGVIAISLSAKVAVSSLMQEPFKRVPVIWIIFEAVLGQRLRNYEAARWESLISEWKESFKRADVVIFPNHALAMLYSLVDTGNFLVLPGSTVEVWEADQFMATNSREDIRKHFGLQYHDIAVAVVGSPFTYKGTWREHALIMRSFLPVIEVRALRGDSGLLNMLFLSGGLTCDYESSLQAMAHQFGFTEGTISYHCNEMDINSVIWASDIVIYSSLQDEQAFPDILTRAMAYGKLIVAPSNPLFQNHITDGVNGILYEYGNFEKLSVVLTKVVPEVFLSKYIQNVSSAARVKSNGILVDEIIRGYADLLDSVIQVPSEMLLPKSLLEVPEAIPINWQWELFKDSIRKQNWNGSVSDGYMKMIPSVVMEMEIQFNKTSRILETSQSIEIKEMEMLSHSEWLEEKTVERIADIKQLEEDELMERFEISLNSWEEIYRSTKKAERARDELRERDDGELERTGQLLCIYEPYLGSGAWQFLHQGNPLYRGLSLSSKQRRPDSDDIDAALRLPLLNNSYYRDVLCEFGTFLAISKQIDRIHKNSWIGFQSWQAKGQKVALSKVAEKRVLEAIQLRTHGGALYFWANFAEVISPDVEGIGATVKSFWSYCDAVNNNSCRVVFLDAFKHMYGLTSSWTSLPPMPSHAGTWALLNCWIMPTSSFLEFIMFSRMFIDAMDSQHYDEHVINGKCCLGITSEEARHCYCRVLELLVNVWAYHSGRRMVYVDPTTGYMQEQHSLEARRNHMWVKFFELGMLKSMDEDMAEEGVEDANAGRWLWPHTGEIYSQRIYEKEQHVRYGLKMEKQRLNRERLERMRSRHRQRPLAGG